MLSSLSHQTIFPFKTYTEGSWTSNSHLLDVSCFTKFFIYIQMAFWQGAIKTLDVEIVHKDRITGQSRIIDTWDQITSEAAGMAVFKVYEETCFDQISASLFFGGTDITCDFGMYAILKT